MLCNCVHPRLHRDENGRAYCSRCTLPISLFRIRAEGLDTEKWPTAAAVMEREG